MQKKKHNLIVAFVLIFFSRLIEKGYILICDCNENQPYFILLTTQRGRLCELIWMRRKRGLRGKKKKERWTGFDAGRNRKKTLNSRNAGKKWGKEEMEKRLLSASFRVEVWSRRGRSRSAQSCPQHLHSGLVTWAEVPAALPLTQPV